MFERLRHRIRNTFIAGLIFILPLSITFILFNFLFTKLDKLFAPAFEGLLDFAPFKGKIPNNFPGSGIVATVILIFLAGVFVKNVFGKRLVQLGEYLLYKIPLVSNIYKTSKQFFEGVSLSSKEAFSSVVLVEFPREGAFSLGFVTGTTRGEVQKKTEEVLINVFIPTTPNPTSGYLVMFPENSVQHLEMTVEDGIKMVISGGIITPPFRTKRYFDNDTEVDSGSDHLEENG